MEAQDIIKARIAELERKAYALEKKGQRGRANEERCRMDGLEIALAIIELWNEGNTMQEYAPVYEIKGCWNCAFVENDECVDPAKGYEHPIATCNMGMLCHSWTRKDEK